MTRKRTKLRSLTADFIIVVLCLCVSGYFGYLFWKDLNSSTTRTDKDTIAVIEFKQRIAQRKYSDRVVWERLQNNSPLYNGDTLRTASQSEATITFNNKAAIDVHENTMIQIFYTEEAGVTVNVGGGDIEIDTSTMEVSGAQDLQSALVVKTSGGSVLNVKAGSKVTATTDEESGLASFSLQQGFADISNETGASVALEKGQTASIESNGDISKGNFAVTSISKNLRILNFEENEKVPVQIEWKATEELQSKPVKIEISKSKSFEQIENTYVVKDSDHFTLPADDGVIYWRVSVETETQKNVESVEGKIRVDNVTPVQCVSPVDGSSFNYRKDLPKITFAWNGNDLSTNYKLEVSDTPDFSSDKIIDMDFFQTSATCNNLKEGTYYWRVTPYYSINNTGYADTSEVNSFSITKNLELTNPSLSIPAQNATLTYQVKDFNVTFIWKSDVKDAAYKLLIAKDENFSNVVYETETNDKRIFNNFSEVLPTGSYFWKVVRNSVEDTGACESEIRQFSVIKYVPGENRLLYPPENYSVEDTKLASTSFMWKLADEYKSSAAESIIQIAKDPDFNNIISEGKTKELSYTNVKLNSGNYFWRIGVHNTYEDKLEYTKPRSLFVVSELGAPQILLPENGREFVAVKNTPVSLKWTPVEGADGYKVTVTDLSDNKSVFVQSVSYTEIKDFVLPEYITTSKSKFRFSVQAYAEQTDITSIRQGKVVSSDFSVRTAIPVKLVGPANNTKYDGLSAIRKPIVLEWTSGLDRAAKSTIILRRVQSNGSLREVRRVDNINALSLSRLSPGTYEWTVVASTDTGLPINAVENRRFTVTAVPQLPAPALSEPKNNFIIGPEYLKKNRSINFNWKPVPGATDYSFTLYLRKNDGSVKKVYSEKNIKGTSVKFKKLESLDIGYFEWNVTPYCHAKDGFEEQSGKTVTGKFSIQFDLPETVQTKDPGRVYGE